MPGCGSPHVRCESFLLQPFDPTDPCRHSSVATYVAIFAPRGLHSDHLRTLISAPRNLFRAKYVRPHNIHSILSYHGAYHKRSRCCRVLTTLSGVLSTESRSSESMCPDACARVSHRDRDPARWEFDRQRGRICTQRPVVYCTRRKGSRR